VHKPGKYKQIHPIWGSLEARLGGFEPSLALWPATAPISSKMVPNILSLAPNIFSLVPNNFYPASGGSQPSKSKQILPIWSSLEAHWSAIELRSELQLANDMI